VPIAYIAGDGLWSGSEGFPMVVDASEALGVLA